MWVQLLHWPLMNEKEKAIVGEAVVKLSQHLQKQFGGVQMPSPMKVVVCMDLLAAMVAEDMSLSTLEKDKLFDFLNANMFQYALDMKGNRN